MEDLSVRAETFHVEQKPISWDLSAPVIGYPLEYRGIEYLVFLKPYSMADLKEYLQAKNPKSAPRGSKVMVSDDPYELASAKLFKRYFERFAGLVVNGEEWPSEKIMQWVEAKQPGYADVIVGECFGGIKTDLAYVDQEDVFDLSTGTVVKTFQYIYLDSLKACARVEMFHRFRKITESDYRRYQEATGQTAVDRKRAEWQSATNYGIIEQLYDQAIVEVEGMTVGGEACLEANRSNWVRLVPFWHKHLVLISLFDTVHAKNE